MFSKEEVVNGSNWLKNQMSKLFNIKNITVLSHTFTRKLNTASFNSLRVTMFEMCPAPLRVPLLLFLYYRVPP